jgi:hypothetical protein
MPSRILVNTVVSMVRFGIATANEKFQVLELACSLWTYVAAFQPATFFAQKCFQFACKPQPFPGSAV